MALVTAFERRKVRFNETVMEHNDGERRSTAGDDEENPLTEGLTDRLYSLASAEDEFLGPAVEVPRVSNINSCTANLAKAIIGVGITAFPKAFTLLGVGPSILALTITAALTFLSCVGLSRASQRTGRYNYPELVRTEFGPIGARLLELCLLLNCGGMLLTYFVVLNNLLTSAVGEASTALLSPVLALQLPLHSAEPIFWSLTLPDLILLAIVVVVIAPLVSFRHLSTVAFSSAIGMTALLFWSAAVLSGVIAAIHKGTAQPLHFLPSPESWQGSYWDLINRASSVLPVMLTAYICHFSFHPVTSELHPYRPSSISRLLLRALLLCSAVYCLVSLGSLALLGEHVSDNVLVDFTVHKLSPIIGSTLARAAQVTVQASYFISLLGNFPLQMWPCRDSIWRLTMGDQPVVGVAYYAITYGCLLFAYIGAVMLPSIWIPLQVIGATAGAMIAFVFPGMLMLNNSYAVWPFVPPDLDISSSWKRLENTCGWLLVVLGLLVGGAGVANALGLFNQ